MGKALADRFPVARETFDEADAAFARAGDPGRALSAICWEGPEQDLQLTEVTQPAVVTASVAAYRVLAAQGITPSFVAGHSLGEYSAHVAAGTLSFGDALGIVRRRGR